MNHSSPLTSGGDLEEQQLGSAARRQRAGETTSTSSMHNNYNTHSSIPPLIDGDEKNGIMMGAASSSSATPYTSMMEKQQALPMVVASESHTRSLLKGVTWRCLATATTVGIAWLVTGHVQAAIQIGFVEFFAKLAIYYAHERLWAKIKL